MRFLQTRSFDDLKRGFLVTLALLGALELILRLSGFEFDNVPRRVELYGAEALADGNRAGEVIQRHPALLWALVPGATLGKLKVNDAGFLGHMPALEPGMGTLRIVCLGDSNVALGDEPYPQRLQGLLDRQKPGRYEVINAGVPGYTSLQGLRLLEGRVAKYAPHLVTVQFGWNDHWLSDKRMSERLAEPSRAFRLRNAFIHLRIYQLGLYLRSRVGGALEGDASDEYQVLPEEYREYLERMVALGEERGFRVALLTVPSNFELSDLGPFLRMGFRHDHPNPKARPAALLEVHQRLNQIVREVSSEKGALLVDLDRVFDALPERDSYFLEDAIHVSQRGRELIAQELVRNVLGEESAGRRARQRAELHVAGAGRYALDDPRVMLKNFRALEPTADDPAVYRAATRGESYVIVAGLRAVTYRVVLVFEKQAAGRAVSCSATSALAPEHAVIGEDGRASLTQRYQPDASGVLSIRLVSSPAIESGRQPPAGPDQRGPALVAVELAE